MDLTKDPIEWKYYWIIAPGSKHWQIAQCRSHHFNGLVFQTIDKKQYQKEVLVDWDHKPIERK